MNGRSGAACFGSEPSAARLLRISTGVLGGSIEPFRPQPVKTTPAVSAMVIGIMSDRFVLDSMAPVRR